MCSHFSQFCLLPVFFTNTNIVHLNDLCSSVLCKIILQYLVEGRRPSVSETKHLWCYQILKYFSLYKNWPHPFSLIGSLLKLRWGLVSILTDQLLAFPLGYDVTITPCMITISAHSLASAGYRYFVLCYLINSKCLFWTAEIKKNFTAVIFYYICSEGIHLFWLSNVNYTI
jgi:hypothetical protein